MRSLRFKIWKIKKNIINKNNISLKVAKHIIISTSLLWSNSLYKHRHTSTEKSTKTSRYTYCCTSCEGDSIIYHRRWGFSSSLIILSVTKQNHEHLFNCAQMGKDKLSTNHSIYDVLNHTPSISSFASNHMAIPKNYFIKSARQIFRKARYE